MRPSRSLVDRLDGAIQGSRLVSRLFARRAALSPERWFLVFDSQVIASDGLRAQGTRPAVDRESLLQLLRVSLDNQAGSKKKRERITLILPPCFFQFIPFELPGVEEGQVRKALPLQIPALFPGSGDRHLLAYMNFNYVDGQGTSLWMDAAIADDIFVLFDKHNLFVHRIVPRPLSFVQGSDAAIVEDEDSFQKTLVRVDGKKILDWYVLAGSDCENREFIADYLAHRDALFSSFAGSSDDGHIAVNSKTVTSLQPGAGIACFVPERYRDVQTARNRVKVMAGLATILLLAVILGGYPFAVLYLEEKELVAEIARFEQENAEIVKYSEQVDSFEEKWGVINEFPYIDVFRLLTELDRTIPKDTWLSSLSLDKGVLELIGYSPDPEKILILLTRMEIFEDVSYSQVVRSDGKNHQMSYFGIQCRIRNVDVLAYLDRYFQATGIE